jgi:hypothetical protein
MANDESALGNRGEKGLQMPDAERSDDGVDVTLIRWILSLTPAQRLEVLQQNVNSIVALRNAAGR